MSDHHGPAPITSATIEVYTDTDYGEGGAYNYTRCELVVHRPTDPVSEDGRPFATRTDIAASGRDGANIDVLALADLLRRVPPPTDAEIGEVL